MSDNDDYDMDDNDDYGLVSIWVTDIFSLNKYTTGSHKTHIKI